MPFQYSPYDGSPYANSIAALLRERGNIAAQQAVTVGAANSRAAEQTGYAYANMGQNLGQIASALPQAIEASRTAELQRRDIAAQASQREAAAQRAQLEQ